MTRHDGEGNRGDGGDDDEEEEDEDDRELVMVMVVVGPIICSPSLPCHSLLYCGSMSDTPSRWTRLGLSRCQ